MIVLSTSTNEIELTRDTISQYGRKLVLRHFAHATRGIIHPELMRSYHRFAIEYAAHTMKDSTTKYAAFELTELWDQRSIMYAKVISLYDRAHIHELTMVFEAMMCSGHFNARDDVIDFIQLIKPHKNVANFKFMVTHTVGLTYFDELQMAKKEVAQQASFWVASKTTPFSVLESIFSDEEESKQTARHGFGTGETMLDLMPMDDELYNKVQRIFFEHMPESGPYVWQIRVGYHLITDKRILSIPPGYGKSRVLIAAALILALDGFEVIVNFTNEKILRRDKVDFDKIINFNQHGEYPGAGSITLKYAVI